MPAGYQDPDCTVFVSNVDQKVTPEHLWELFLQAGPLRNVHIPMDRGSGKQRTFGFITYRDEISVSYACELFNTLKLFDRPIYCKPSGENSKQSNSQTPQSQEKPLLDGSSNHSNNHPVQRSPQTEYYNERSNNNYQHRSPYNNSGPQSSRYSGDNQSRQNHSPRHYINNPHERSHEDASYNRNQQPHRGHQHSSPANLNFGGNSPVFMRAMNQVQQINNRNISPFHDSPSHHGPMRNDRGRNYQHSRMNRRQQGYPY